MRIEILGPSGVGKSTVLNAAQKMRANEPEWIGPLEADAIVQSSPRGSKKAMTRAAIDDPDLGAFIDHCISVVTASSMLPSQKISALAILRNSCYESLVLESVPDDTVLVHDELLLHRAYSLLLYSDQAERDGTTYFELVPLPDAAIIFCADEETILSRVLGRNNLPNCYAGLDETGLRRVITTGIEVARVADDVLRARGLPVKSIVASLGVEQAARELHDFCANPRLKERA
jgi:hypothetical protein